MKKCFRFLSLFVACLFFWGKATAATPSPAYLSWSQLPAIPDTLGFAGSFAGVSQGTLLVAGGANFPGGAPWTGAAKVWIDKVFALEKPDGQWQEVGRLPRPLGYGVSVTWQDALICLGGSDAARHYADVFMIRYLQGKISIEVLPALPRAVASASGLVIGDVLYVAGGLAQPDAAAAEHNFWRLDLAAPASKRAWEELPAWPGPARMMAVVGSQDNAFYLFSGVQLVAGKNQQTDRVFLRDAYRYTPRLGWEKLTDLPQSVAGAPSPAFASGQSHLLVFGGDHGRYFAQNNDLKDRHPGFSDQVLGYDTITNTWASFGKMPVDQKADAVRNPQASTWAPVTTPAVVWQGKLVIPGGEVRPAVRTTRVLLGEALQPQGALALWDWLVIGLYFLLTIGISVLVSRKSSSNTEDYFLAKGKIPWWAAGLSIFGTTLSALTFIAVPAKTYATDWVYFLNNMMIVAVAPIIVCFYLPYFRKLKLTSIYEYLEIRFSRPVKLLASLTFLLFQVSRLGVVIYLPSLVVSSLMGIDIVTCIIGTALITTAYCFFGGIEAVVWTDVMQVVVLLGGALLSLVFIVNSLEGGASQLVTEALDHDKFRLAILEWDIAQPVLWVVAIGALLSQLVTFSSDQVVVQRYLTTPTEAEARKAIYTNAWLTIPASLIFFGVGTALWVYFRHYPQVLNPHGRNDDVFPWFIAHQLPAGLSGLVIAGVFAATMSTISSSMNSMATVITKDFYRLFKPRVSDRQQFLFARWTTIVLGLVGSLVSIYMDSLRNASIWDQYLTVIALLGGCLAGMFTAGIFFPRINSTGILVGFAVSGFSLYFVQRWGGINFFLYPAIAIALCVGVGYIVSILLPDRQPQTHQTKELKAR